MKSAGLDPEDPTVRTAVFGQQVTDFMESPVGQYLEARVLSELEDATRRLKTIDPAVWSDVYRIQLEIKWAENYLAWLGAAMQDGLNAEAQLEGEQEMPDA